MATFYSRGEGPFAVGALVAFALLLALNPLVAQGKAGNPNEKGKPGGEVPPAELVAPAIVASTVPDDGMYIAGDALDFTLTFSEEVFVNTRRKQFSLYVGPVIGKKRRSAEYVEGSGSETLTSRYLVAEGKKMRMGSIFYSKSLTLPECHFSSDSPFSEAFTSRFFFGIDSTGMACL